MVVGRPVALSGTRDRSTRLADELYERRSAAAGAGVPVVQCRRAPDDRRGPAVAVDRPGLKAKDHREHVDSAAAVDHAPELPRCPPC